MPIGLDFGSSSVKAVLFDRRGRIRRSVRRPIATRRGRAGRVEHDAGAVYEAAIEALAAAAAGAAPRAAALPLGIATQRSTVLFWDRRSGRPLTPAYSWQDTRGAALCSRLRRRRRGGTVLDTIVARTGLRLSPHYSAAKLAWALRHVHGLRRMVRRGRALWGTLGTYLLWRLSGGAWYGIDHANAQRTLLFDLRHLCWDAELFALFGLEDLLEAPALPALSPTQTAGGLTVRCGGRSLGVRAMTGDQQAALIGLQVGRPGDIAINYGSGAFVLQNLGADPLRVPGLLTALLFSWAQSGPAAGPGGACRVRYAVEGPVNAAATAIDWARRRLRLRVHTAEIDRFLGSDDGRPRRVHFLPAVSGVGAPRWDTTERPRFAGDLRNAGPRELMRAVVESIAMRCAEILRAAPAAAGAAPIVVGGGLTHCATLLQAQADLLQRPLVTLPTPEATAAGVAMMAVRDPAPAPRGRDRRRAGGGLRAGHGALVILPHISSDVAARRYRDWARAVYGERSGGSAR